MILFVGLGNPEPLYKNTRHNLGFRVIDILNKKTKIELVKGANYSLGCGKIGDIDIALAKPSSFMNESGACVLSLCKRLNPDELVIIHDDMDIACGKIKIKKGGSSAGHKGLENIISVLGRDDFLRIRIGIGKPRIINGREYVLSPFNEEEKKFFEAACNMAAEASIMIIEKGVKEAMGKYNRRK